jgi:hypothetical protein
MKQVNGPVGIGGWLLVLCVLLLLWQPLSLGLLASGVLKDLALRGVPLALVLLLRVLVTAFGIAAGLALLDHRPGAVAMAKASLLVSAAMDLFVYATPYFPSNRMPGETPYYIVAALAYYIVWLAYLFRARRVKNTFGGP